MGKSSGKYVGYQKNTNLVKSADFPQHPPVTRVKTDGRIGSVTPSSYLKGGLTVNNNKGQQPHHGPIGGAAAGHMSAGHKGGAQWSPRVAKARIMAKPNPKPYANPVNVDRPTLKKIKPD